MFKKALVMLLVLVFCISIIGVGCSSKESGEKPAGQPAEKKVEKVTLRLGHEMPEDHPYHLGALKFGEILAQKTNGKYEVVVYPNAQLGTQKQMAEMVATNQLDLCLTWQGILEAFDPNTGVVSLPFIFRDWDHVYKVVDGPVGQELFKGVEAKGIKVLTNFNNGLYNIVSRVKIEKPEDVKGIKLRVQPSKVFTDTGEMMGAVVTPLAFSEVYTALQMGAIDAQIQGPINVRKSKHYEVAKFTCENQINFLLEPLMMSMKKFGELPAEDQKAIMEAAKEAADWQREDAEKADGVDSQFLKDNGMQYIKTDIEAWRKATAPIYDKYSQWKDMVAKIQAVQ